MGCCHTLESDAVWELLLLIVWIRSYSFPWSLAKNEGANIAATMTEAHIQHTHRKTEKTRIASCQAASRM